MPRQILRPLTAARRPTHAGRVARSVASRKCARELDRSRDLRSKDADSGICARIAGVGQGGRGGRHARIAGGSGVSTTWCASGTAIRLFRRAEANRIDAGPADAAAIAAPAARHHVNRSLPSGELEVGGSRRGRPGAATPHPGLSLPPSSSAGMRRARRADGAHPRATRRDRRQHGIGAGAASKARSATDRSRARPAARRRRSHPRARRQVTITVDIGDNSVTGQQGRSTRRPRPTRPSGQTRSGGLAKGRDHGHLQAQAPPACAMRHLATADPMIRSDADDFLVGPGNASTTCHQVDHDGDPAQTTEPAAQLTTVSLSRTRSPTASLGSGRDADFRRPRRPARRASAGHRPTRRRCRPRSTQAPSSHPASARQHPAYSQQVHLRDRDWRSGRTRRHGAQVRQGGPPQPCGRRRGSRSPGKQRGEEVRAVPRRLVIREAAGEHLGRDRSAIRSPTGIQPA